MNDDQQRRLEALRRLAEHQAGAQRTVEPPQDQPQLPKIGAASRNATTTASSRMQHGSHRGLALGLLGGLTLLTLILAGVFSLNRPLPPPTPTPTPDPSHALIVTSNANFGSVSLNGKRIVGAFPLLVLLSPGENSITFSAPPFHDRTCRVTLLAQVDTRSGQRVESAGEECAITTADRPFVLNGLAVRNGYLSFEMTGADLPEAERAAAETALWAKLANPLTLHVPVGDYYAIGVTASARIVSARATIPLLATAALAPASQSQNGASCVHLGCAGLPLLPNQAGNPAPVGVWLVRESLVLGWRFTMQSGALVATTPTWDGGEMEVALTYSSSAGWGATSSSLDPFIAHLQTKVIGATCQRGFAVLQALIAQSRLAGQPLSFGQSGLGGPTAPQTDGCFMSVEGATNNPVGSSKEYGQYIWRWGVLLAADAEARALFPFLPNAPQSEIDAVGGRGV